VLWVLPAAWHWESALSLSRSSKWLPFFYSLNYLFFIVLFLFYFGLPSLFSLLLLTPGLVEGFSHF
jgi:hypothetical protein